ncbi:MAG: O-antigen ligase family protein [Coriobacteriia bacterium]|nr:O-antigen ligase family protein [Coriobacteriia bacterium]
MSRMTFNQRQWLLATLIGGAFLGSLVARWTLVAVLAALLLAVAISAYACRPAVLIAAFVALALIIPWDNLSVFPQTLRGIPVAIAFVVAAFVSLLMERVRLGRVASDWDVALFVAALLASAAFGSGSGGLRQLGLLCLGSAVCIWARRADDDERAIRKAVLWAIAVVGAAQGGIATVQRVAPTSLFQDLLPSYEGTVHQFSLALGERATGLAGHPLRLGTVCMMGVVASASLLTKGRKVRIPALAMLFSAGSGLLLSGARGAWLGALVGAAVLTLLQLKHLSPRSVAMAGASSAAAAVAAYATGAVRLLRERLFGGAQHPLSFQQRSQVLEVAKDALVEKPFFGHGFESVFERMYSSGLRLPNLENEYVALVLSSGVVGLAAFLVVAVRSVSSAARSLARDGDALTLLSLAAALLINIGTYNTFSWTGGVIATFAILGLMGRSDGPECPDSELPR